MTTQTAGWTVDDGDNLYELVPPNGQQTTWTASWTTAAPGGGPGGGDVAEADTAAAALTCFQMCPDHDVADRAAVALLARAEEWEASQSDS